MRYKFLFYFDKIIYDEIIRKGKLYFENEARYVYVYCGIKLLKYFVYNINYVIKKTKMFTFLQKIENITSLQKHFF